MAQVNESLAQKMATRADYDQTIAETEAAYKKVGQTASAGIPQLFNHGHMTAQVPNTLLGDEASTPIII